MKKWFIYTLKDPRTKEVRYVGKARDPEARYKSGHKKGKGNGAVRVQWIAELNDAGSEPIMEIVDECFDGDVKEVEFFWMMRHLQLGAQLTNSQTVPKLLLNEQNQRLDKIAEKLGTTRRAVRWLMIEYAMKADLEDVIQNGL